MPRRPPFQKNTHRDFGGSYIFSILLQSLWFKMWICSKSIEVFVSKLFTPARALWHAQTLVTSAKLVENNELSWFYFNMYSISDETIIYESELCIWTSKLLRASHRAHMNIIDFDILHLILLKDFRFLCSILEILSGIVLSHFFTKGNYSLWNFFLRLNSSIF